MKLNKLLSMMTGIGAICTITSITGCTVNVGHGEEKKETIKVVLDHLLAFDDDEIQNQTPIDLFTNKIYQVSIDTSAFQGGKYVSQNWGLVISNESKTTFGKISDIGVKINGKTQIEMTQPQLPPPNGYFCIIDPGYDMSWVVGANEELPTTTSQIVLTIELERNINDAYIKWGNVLG